MNIYVHSDVSGCFDIIYAFLLRLANFPEALKVKQQGGQEETVCWQELKWALSCLEAGSNRNNL